MRASMPLQLRMRTGDLVYPETLSWQGYLSLALRNTETRSSDGFVLPFIQPQEHKAILHPCVSVRAFRIINNDINKFKLNLKKPFFYKKEKKVTKHQQKKTWRIFPILRDLYLFTKSKSANLFFMAREKCLFNSRILKVSKIRSAVIVSSRF